MNMTDIYSPRISEGLADEICYLVIKSGLDLKITLNQPGGNHAGHYFEYPSGKLKLVVNLDLDEIQELADMFGHDFDQELVMTLAHELGHISQFVNGYYTRTMAIEGTVGCERDAWYYAETLLGGFHPAMVVTRDYSLSTYLVAHDDMDVEFQSLGEYIAAHPQHEEVPMNVLDKFCNLGKAGKPLPKRGSIERKEFDLAQARARVEALEQELAELVEFKPIIDGLDSGDMHSWVRAKAAFFQGWVCTTDLEEETLQAILDGPGGRYTPILCLVAQIGVDGNFPDQMIANLIREISLEDLRPYCKAKKFELLFVAGELFYKALSV